MNISIASHTPALADFVFRSADRMRIDGCANAVAREGLSLSLQCEHEALLDHYLSLLLQRLRQEAPEHSIEVYFPANTDSLLGRFNEALARQSVEQATRHSNQASPAQIWIVHDAQAMPEAEIQLLARLIQNFPGANIRAILLMSGPNAGQNNLAAFGRKILRWDIEAPNPEQAQAALEAARTEGRLLPVQQLLKRINRQAWADDATENLDNTVAAVLLQAQEQAKAQQQAHANARSASAKDPLQNFHTKGLEAIALTKQRLSSWRQTNMRPLLWVILALALSTLIMLWLQPEAFGVGQPKPAQTVPMPLPIEWPESSTSSSTSNNAPNATPNSAPPAAPATPLATPPATAPKP